MDRLQDEIDGITEVVDPFEDDTPIQATCDLSSPEVCEPCQ